MTSKYDKIKELPLSKSKPCYKIDLKRTGVALYTECTHTLLVVEGFFDILKVDKNSSFLNSSH